MVVPQPVAMMEEGDHGGYFSGRADRTHWLANGDEGWGGEGMSVAGRVKLNTTLASVTKILHVNSQCFLPTCPVV